MKFTSDRPTADPEKAARKIDPGIRYFDYIHARKAAMEALAREA